MKPGGGFVIRADTALKGTGGTDLLARGNGELSAAVRAVMEKAGEAAAENAKRLAPVKTGRLRDSIGWAVVSGPDGSLETAVGTDVPYAAAQELGTSRIPGKHYLENGLTAGAAEVLGRG